MAQLARREARQPQGRILSGPFAGMAYLNEAHGSALNAKLLGVYERELHPVWTELVRRDFDRVVVLGAAEGYYAVGLARYFPQAKVIAFETDEKARALVRELSALNQVAARMSVQGVAGPVAFAQALPPEPASADLVICDIEGAERELLDPQSVPALGRAAILVELHEFAVPGIGALLRARFSSTHRIREIPTQARTRADYPFTGWPLRFLPEKSIIRRMEEFRPGPMSWLWMQPHDATRG
jgi:hypothetical protein